MRENGTGQQVAQLHERLMMMMMMMMMMMIPGSRDFLAGQFFHE